MKIRIVSHTITVMRACTAEQQSIGRMPRSARHKRDHMSLAVMIMSVRTISIAGMPHQLTAQRISPNVYQCTLKIPEYSSDGNRLVKETQKH
jgi:hypothetical protein